MKTKKPKSTKPVYYHCSTFNINFYFHIGWSVEDFAAYAKKSYNYVRNSEYGDGTCLPLGDKGSDHSTAYAIWIRNKNAHSILAHECLHAALFIFDDIGVKYDGDNSEALCYLLDSLMRESKGKKK